MYTELEGLGLDIWRSSPLELCQTRNYNGKRWKLPSYLYHREVQPGDLVFRESPEPSTCEANERDKVGDEDEEEEGILEYNS